MLADAAWYEEPERDPKTGKEIDSSEPAMEFNDNSLGILETVMKIQK